MKIGYDVSQTGKLKAGCGYFADSLIRHLTTIDTNNTYSLYPTFGSVYWDPDWSTDTCHLGHPNVHRGLGHKTFGAMQQFWNSPPVDYEAQLGGARYHSRKQFFLSNRSIQSLSRLHVL